MNPTIASISTLEKRALLVFTLLPLLFFLSAFVEVAVRDYQSSRNTGISFAVDDPTPRTPGGMHLLTIPIFLSLIRPQRFFIPSILTGIYCGLLVLSFYIRVDGKSFFGGPIPGDPSFFRELYLKTWIWDYVAILFVIVLVPWLLSIIYRLTQPGARQASLDQS